MTPSITNAETDRGVAASRPRWKTITLLAGLAGVLSTTVGTVARNQTIWQVASPVRPSAGGLEAERDTWVRIPRKFEQMAERSGQEWVIKVAGDTRPTMRRLRLESLGGKVDSPFVLSDKNYDFRSVPRLVQSILHGAKTDEEKALAVRDLLIGEGFYFHFIPPPTPDPIHRMTNVGYGFCGHHSQIFDELAQAAGLRSSICSHPFGYGHASNQFFYGQQWHFIDTDAETFIRRPDGVIPSYEDIRSNPSLIPPGDAYGQDSFGIDGTRYARALYTSDTTCYERKITSDSTYGSLTYPLRPGEAITWEWEDADFTHNRTNQIPVYGTGRVEFRPRLADFTARDGGVRESSNAITLDPAAESGFLRMQVPTAYPILDVTLSARLKGSASEIRARVSKNGSDPWLELKPRESASRTAWHVVIPDPDKWEDRLDSEKVDNQSRSLAAGHYGYWLEIQLTRSGGAAPALDALELATVFRQYPPALPFLKFGENTITYVDDGASSRQVRVTLEWEERRRAPGLSERAVDWGWGETRVLSQANGSALPTVATGVAGTLHTVYSVGQPGSRRIASRQYKNGAWSPEVLITAPGQDANHPVAAQDSAGTLWVAYQSGGLWEGADVYVVQVRDEKPSLPERMNTTDTHRVAFFPSITAHGRMVAVSWEGGQIDKDEKTEWGTEVGWLRIYDGSNWSAPRLIKGIPFTNLGLPKVYYDPRGHLHLTATKGPRYYRDLSENASPFQWLTPDWTYHSRGASLAADSAGDVWAVFDGQNSGTTNEIYVRMLPASAPSAAIANWTQTLRISEDDKRPSIYPDLLAADPSRLAVIWMDYRHKNAEVYSKIFSGGRWSPDLLVSAPADENARRAAETMTPNQILWARPEGLQSEYPHLAQVADGSIWAVWQESMDGKPHRVMARPLHWPGAHAENTVGRWAE